MYGGMVGSDESEQLRCVERVRMLLSGEYNPPIQAVVDAGFVPILIPFLTHTSEQLQVCVCCC